MTRGRARLVGAAAATLVVLALTRLVPHELPLGTVLSGVVDGSLDGLLALGLVLMFRTTRAVNFAYGAMGAVAATAAVSLYLGPAHAPYWAALGVAALGGALVGAAVGGLVALRFSGSPPLVLTVATIGLSELLGGLALFEPRWLGGPAVVGGFRTGLSGLALRVSPVVLDGNDLLVAVVVPVVLGAAAWLFLRTDVGRAVRAIADNPERARLLGLPARGLTVGVFACAGLVAGLAVMLAAPARGVPIGVAAGPEILLPPLAAAVVARMESLGVAFGAGVGLGVLDELVRLDVHEQAVATPVFLGVVLVALLVRKRGEGRAEQAEEAEFASAGAGLVRPLPEALAREPLVRVLRGALLGALATGALALALLFSPSRLDQLSAGIVEALAVVSLVVLSGWGGTISLGQMAIVGVGAITAGDLLQHVGLDLFLALGAAGAAGAAAAVVLGAPALRVRGLYLAVTTLGFAVAANDFFFNPTNFPGLLPTEVVRPVLWQRFPLSSERVLYLVCLGALVAAVVASGGIRRARPGRALVASRDNRRAAEAVGVPSARVQLGAFVVAGVVAGVAGGLDAVLLGSVGYQSFPPSASVLVFSMAVIGGLGSLAGALAGSALLVVAGIALPAEQLLVGGAGVLLVLLAVPGGLAAIGARVREALVVGLLARSGNRRSVWADEGGGPERDGASPGELARSTGDGGAPFGEAGPTLEALPRSGDDAGGLVCARGVSASYGSLRVLFGVDLVVRKGEVVALLGTNGAGKSSLLRALAGLLAPSSGSVRFGGREVARQRAEQLARAGLALVPGGRGVFGSLSVEDNLRLSTWAVRHDRKEAERRRRDVLSRFPQLAGRMGVLAGSLSGGEQQMLSLSMALCTKPLLVCIDELSLGLSPAVVEELVAVVRRLPEDGTTVLVVDQSVDVALKVAARAVFLEKGRVRFSGATKDLAHRRDLLRAVFVRGELPGAARQRADGHAKPHAGVGANGRGSEAALELRGLTKRFGGITAVDHVDLVVRPGEVVGLVGHNGAGKTTVFDLVSGFLLPDGGRVLLQGEDVTALPPHARAVRGLGRSFQEARLYPTLTVLEAVCVALERHLANRDPLAAALRLPASTDAEAEAQATALEILEQLGLRAYLRRPVADLSTGTRRFVELACALAQRPSVLLLDEPTAGVAKAETEALGRALSAVAAGTGAAVLLVEHDMDLVRGVTSRLVALELGRVIATGEPEAVLSDPRVIASYLGTAGTRPRRASRPGGNLRVCASRRSAPTA